MSADQRESPRPSLGDGGQDFRPGLGLKPEKVSRGQAKSRVATKKRKDGRPIKRQRGEVQDLVLSRLRRGLMIGAFVPGQKITLRRLAELLGTSPMPVRKAINQLAGSNVLQTLPNRSVAVPRMSADRFRELTRVRQAVEGLAAELACANSTPDLVRKLTTINVGLHQSIKERNILDCLELNQEFHFTLYGQSRSSILYPLIESLWLQAGPVLYLSLSDSNMPWSAGHHDELLEALKRKQPSAARRAIVRDIGDTTKSLLRLSMFSEQRDLGFFKSIS
ncbi:MAG: GntR family transcriptional regulator [Xanthobacteraceae bacterium]|jgi:DNA-binding GntR family transcriptional regulator